ncbi:MAG: cellulase family glycosylhydrolase, partial [Huintestinicola sp.]
DLSASVKIIVGTRISSVSVDKTDVSMKKGDTYTIKPAIKPADASYKAVSYSSSNKKAATVSSKGVITAVGAGSAKITVKAADGSGKTAVINVTVKGASSGTSSSSAPNISGFNTKITAVELTADMKIGWNLGNSLECTGKGLDAETIWGNPKTTKKMITDIKKMGFNTVRIPVSWGFHTDGTGKINADWMKRVKEVVDYAYDQGMYVILNDHHDNSYYDIGKCVSSDSFYKESEKKMKYVWKQIATTFKDYSEKLIFETLNEPRTEGSAKEWAGGTPEEREIIDKLNNAIYKSIRSTGGKNEYRFIMMPAYAATSNLSIVKQMQLPDDDRVIISVHAYDSYNFAMNASGSSEFTSSDMKSLDRFFDNLNSYFVSKGRAVIIGEFGCINKDNISDRCAWAEYFVKGARKYNIVCVVWDNNAGGKGNETFGLYNRKTGEWYFPELAKAYIKAAK